MEVIGRQWERDGVDRFLDLLPEGRCRSFSRANPGSARPPSGARRSRQHVVAPIAFSPAEPPSRRAPSRFSASATSSKACRTRPSSFFPSRSVWRWNWHFCDRRARARRIASAWRAERLSVLRASAAEAPTVVAIDDAQWLDPPSADVLRFVVHRLTDERLGLLVSVRDGEARPLELDQAFPGGGLVRLRLESLSFEELEQVVRLHLPVSFTRPTWRALHRISGGIRSSRSSSPRRSSGGDGDRRARSCRSRRRLLTRCASGSRRSRRAPGRRSSPSPPWRSRPCP